MVEFSGSAVYSVETGLRGTLEFVKIKSAENDEIANHLTRFHDIKRVRCAECVAFRRGIRWIRRLVGGNVIVWNVANRKLILLKTMKFHII